MANQIIYTEDTFDASKDVKELREKVEIAKLLWE